MQSYNGTIHLFPNWDKQNDAAFSTLRAVGAFLVSSKCSGGEVTFVYVQSEKGSECKLKNPWKDAKVQLVRNGRIAEILHLNSLVFKTSPGEEIELRKL